MVAHHITINYIVERRNKQNESNIVMAIFFFFLYNYKCRSFVLTLMNRRFVYVEKYNGCWIKQGARESYGKEIRRDTGGVEVKKKQNNGANGKMFVSLSL